MVQAPLSAAGAGEGAPSLQGARQGLTLAFDAI